MSDKLTVESPSVRCGHCGFTSIVAGLWAIEFGRLVFRAESDPFPFRGPGIDWCGECGTELTGIILEQTPTTPDGYHEQEVKLPPAPSKETQ